MGHKHNIVLIHWRRAIPLQETKPRQVKCALHPHYPSGAKVWWSRHTSPQLIEWPSCSTIDSYVSISSGLPSFVSPSLLFTTVNCHLEHQQLQDFNCKYMCQIGPWLQCPSRGSHFCVVKSRSSFELTSSAPLFQTRLSNFLQLDINSVIDIYWKSVETITCINYILLGLFGKLCTDQ